MKQAGDDYELLDSGNGRKLERFGSRVLVRPAAGAVWKPALRDADWEKANAWFDRDGGNSWTFSNPLPSSWNIAVNGLKFKLATTPFGHLGLFPEQRKSWRLIERAIESSRAGGRAGVNTLNLFAYSGGSTLAAAKAGARVCHLDSSKGMVARARENAQLNDLGAAPIRWIVDDANKFLDREARRGACYDAVILDPPSFGRGKSGEVYKIENDLQDTLDKCVALMGKEPLFLLLSCHTPGYTPIVLKNLLEQAMRRHDGAVEAEEMLLSGQEGVMPLPSGAFACWTAKVRR